MKPEVKENLKVFGYICAGAAFVIIAGILMLTWTMTRLAILD